MKTSDDIELKLQSMGLSLPAAQAPGANYIPFRQYGRLLYLSGHAPKDPDGNYLKGKLSSLDDVEKGYQASQLAALNLLATLKSAIQRFDRVESFVKILGMVNTSSDFEFHPRVIDGCSDLLVNLFGESARHARSAVGMNSLPHGIMVEIEAIVLLREDVTVTKF